MASLVAVLTAIAMITSGCSLFHNKKKSSEGPNSGIETVDIGGVECTPKQNIKTYLFIGVDNTETHEEDHNIGGQSDVLRILVVDRTAGTYTQLPINRNTITSIGNYDENGEYIGESEVQISYAHMGGDGGGDLSCKNTVDAVSNLLMGQKIDGYLRLDMEGIKTINSLAGGVTVTIEDDFSNVDPSLKKGETIKLTDDQAYNFIHAREGMDDKSNESRMRRQDAYIDGLKDILYDKVKADESYVFTMYDALSDYMKTDLAEKEFGRIANALMECESGGVLEITGTKGKDRFDYDTFTPDKESIEEVVRELFYRPVD